MADAILKLYKDLTEYGTIGNPLAFGVVTAGQTLEHPSNPFLLWNDKGGSVDSVPAKNINIQVLSMWLQDEDMGISDGLGGQTFTCSVIPVVDNYPTVLYEVSVKVGTVEWDRVASFDYQESTAEVFTFNGVTGVVTFGDSINGKIPPIGEHIYITYMPNLIPYGKEVYESTWLEVQSFGCTTNTVAIVDEQKTASDTTHVIISNPYIISVAGVWLQIDPTHAGTNYYTSGSYNALTGEITLGTPLPTATEPVLINYSYTAIDDIEGSWYPIGYDTIHTFANQIPKNNAKSLRFRVVCPDDATPSGGSQVNFRIRLTYKQ